MFSISGLNTLASLASALTSGNDNAVSRIVEKKLEGMGSELLAQLLASALPGMGVASRIGQAIETGGVSELDRARSQWLNKLRPAPLPYQGVLSKFTSQMQNGVAKANERAGAPPGKRWTWNKSRQEWLDTSWKHDWRSQPRDTRGRWVPGRLRHPYMAQGARKLRRKRQMAARKAVRGMIDRGD